MAASNDRARVDIGFEGGSTLTISVSPLEADSLEQRLRAGDGGVADLETEEGRLLGHVHLGLRVIRVNAEERFLQALQGVLDPEHKRKIIGKLFIEVFEES